MCTYEPQEDIVKHTKGKVVDGGNKLSASRLREFLFSFFESWSKLRLSVKLMGVSVQALLLGSL